MQPHHEHLDVLVIGAGISGISAAYHLQRRCPRRTFAIFEARDRLGGTWDLFRFPGVRSDSDPQTLGFSFRPWAEARAFADGPSILRYLDETAAAFGIDRRIRYRHRVAAAAWDSGAARWTVEFGVEEGEGGAAAERRTLTCNFLALCGGYYRYAGGYSPSFPGEAEFGGQIVHPQFWPDAEGFSFAGKKVVVIGSGATAVTLVPAMAASAAHVTMLQRSASYVAALPSRDAFTRWAYALLPLRLAYAAVRWRNVLRWSLLYAVARAHPDKARRQLAAAAAAELGADAVRAHFTPAYAPWDQRMCVAPDADLFRCIKRGTASVVTDVIDAFTPTGLRLRSGQELEADVVVKATGLEMQLLGGLDITVDGVPLDVENRLMYKGVMLSGVPNLVMTFGYFAASWTLKADLTSEYLCRLLGHMERCGWSQCRPMNQDPGLLPLPFTHFSSGYVVRAQHLLPKQGDRRPWRLNSSYLWDLWTLRYGRLADGVLQFGRAPDARRGKGEAPGPEPKSSFLAALSKSWTPRGRP